MTKNWPKNVSAIKLDPVRLKKAFEDFRHTIRHDWMQKYGGSCPDPDCDFEAKFVGKE